MSSPPVDDFLVGVHMQRHLKLARNQIWGCLNPACNNACSNHNATYRSKFWV